MGTTIASWRSLAGVAVLMLAGTAWANDSTVVMGVGGLVPVTSETVSMASEDLFISDKEIRIRYEFLNTGPADVTTLVAFPLPVLKLGELTEVPVDYPGAEQDNFVNFTVTADGRPVPVQTEIRAVHQGKDVTELLKTHKVPLNGADTGYVTRLGELPKATKAALIAAGLAEEADETMLIPRWDQHTRFFWSQTFPAGRPVVLEHRYQPVVGHTWLVPEDLAAKAAGVDETPPGTRYCLQGATAKAVTARFAEQRRKGGEFPLLAVRELEYILTTARTWHGPIRRFRLTVETGAADILLATCMAGLRQTGPSRYEMQAADFVPAAEFTAMLITPWDGEGPPEASQLMPDSSSRKLTPADLAGWSGKDLRLIRNEIYARHGFIFNSDDLKAYFAQKPWYKPTTRSVTLSPIEQANVELIKSLER